VGVVCKGLAFLLNICRERGRDGSDVGSAGGKSPMIDGFRAGCSEEEGGFFGLGEGEGFQQGAFDCGGGGKELSFARCDQGGGGGSCSKCSVGLVLSC